MNFSPGTGLEIFALGSSTHRTHMLFRAVREINSKQTALIAIYTETILDLTKTNSHHNFSGIWTGFLHHNT